jgi:AAA+ superfamily predicted ATPase
MSSGAEARQANVASPRGLTRAGGGPYPALGGDVIRLNAEALARELDWLAALLQARLALHFGQSAEVASVQQLPPPELPRGSALAELVQSLGLGWRERLVLVLALAPHARPALLDLLFVRNTNLDRAFAEFGGATGKQHRGFLPTLETAAFLAAGEDLAERLQLRALFDDAHPLRRLGVLRLHSPEQSAGEPLWAQQLGLSAEYVERLTSGLWHKPDYTGEFPAKRLTTRLSWADLVLAPEVMAEVRLLQAWLAHGERLMQDWGLARGLKPGFRSLFVGPPGTGKTLTATLLGQAAEADVYRIDLSMMVSKYIGETEKNLANVFDQASTRRWILFFDEADALFGKRTATGSANERYANQEVSYLLQRIEDFPGTVLLASNLKGNIDEAFARRFQSQINFPMPDAEQRLRLWQALLRPPVKLAPGLKLEPLAEAHEISGGAIANVVRYAALLALAQHKEGRAGEGRIGRAELQRALAQELRKEGRTP